MTVSQSTKRPEKPRPDFPLHAHSNGQWAKKFKGKRCYFGPWDDPDGAEQRWLEFQAKYTLGIDPVATRDSIVIGDVVDAFLAAKDAKVQIGELSPYTFSQYQRIGQWLLDNIGDDSHGKHLPVDARRRRRKRMPPRPVRYFGAMSPSPMSRHRRRSDDHRSELTSSSKRSHASPTTRASTSRIQTTGKLSFEPSHDAWKSPHGSSPAVVHGAEERRGSPTPDSVHRCDRARDAKRLA